MEQFIIAVLVGVAIILYIILDHRSTMEHLRARRDGSLDHDEYKHGYEDGLKKAANLIESVSASQGSYVDLITAAANSNK